MGPKRILLVDDERILLAVLKRVLETAGYQVFTAETGRAAIDRLEERDVDVVVTDISMPDMDGLEVIRYLKKLAPSVAVIAMSGGDPHQLATARELGAGWAFAKPFDCGELLDALENCPPIGEAGNSVRIQPLIPPASPPV